MSGSERQIAPVAAIIVHDLIQARAAVTVAAALDRPIALWSAPGAAAYLGPGYFSAMVERARDRAPDVSVLAVLDCDDLPGLALAALRHGCAAICYTGPAETAAKLADMARQHDAQFHDRRPAALDLAGLAEPEAACRDWLTDTDPSGLGATLQKVGT